MGLKAFLMENALPVDVRSVAISKRFVEDGKPIEWTIQPITSIQDEAIRKKCTRKVQIVGKKNQYTKEVDTDLYLGKLASACVAYPDLQDIELQDSYGVNSAEELVKAMLTAGEYATLLEEVQSVCGFDVSFEENVEEAKTYSGGRR